MKRIAVCCLVMLGMTFASAAPAGLVPDAEFQTGLELIAGYNYHEPNFMRLDGTQFGLYGSFTYFGWDPLIPEIYMSYVGGDIEYTGGYQSGGSLKGDVANYILNFRVLLGYALYADTLMIKPVTGLGYRYLFQRSRRPRRRRLRTGADLLLPPVGDRLLAPGLPRRVRQDRTEDGVRRPPRRLP